MVRSLAARLQLTLAVAVVASGLWVLANNYAVFVWRSQWASCPPHLFCAVGPLPQLPDPVAFVASYLLFCLASTWAGDSVLEDRMRAVAAAERRGVGRSATSALLFVMGAWSAALLILAVLGFGSRYPILGDGTLADTAFYGSLLVVPSAAMVLGTWIGFAAARGGRQHGAEKPSRDV